MYRDMTTNLSIEAASITTELEQRGQQLFEEHLQFIMDFAKENRNKADRSWPVLLKSNTFFNHVSSYIGGIRKGRQQQ
jgi:hypothetical protein